MSKMSVVVAVNIKCQAATIKQYFVRKNIQISRRIGKNKPVASSNSNNARMSMKTKRGTGLPIVSKKIEKAAGGHAWNERDERGDNQRQRRRVDDSIRSSCSSGGHYSDFWHTFVELRCPTHLISTFLVFTLLISRAPSADVRESPTMKVPRSALCCRTYYYSHALTS